MSRETASPIPSSVWALKWLYWLASALLLISALLLLTLIWSLITVNTNIKFIFINSDGPSGWITGFGYTFLYFFGLYQFWLILRDSIKGVVFTLENVGRFRNIARCLLICGIWTNLLGPLIQGKILSGPAEISFSIQDVPNMIFNWFVAALVLFAIAEIFRQGVLIRQVEMRLKAEQELTV